MSKYIRTKDGRIIDTTKIATGSKYMDFATNDESFRAIFETEPLSKDDTIKELCDGFYLDLGGEFDDTYLRRKDKFEFLKSLALDYIRKGKQVNLYGFIKTSKGLIYVAKAIGKGELELI